MKIMPNLTVLESRVLWIGLLVFSVLVTGAAGQSSKPCNLLILSDVSTEKMFNVALLVTQQMDIIAESKLTFISTDREQALLNGLVISSSNTTWKAGISSTRFSPDTVKHLDLTKAKAIIEGHFDNVDKTHNVAQIVIILTDRPNISGDVSLVQAIRKKKIYVVCLGFQTEALSPVYQAMAADDGHVLEIEKPSDVDGFAEKVRTPICADSRKPCDTDTWKPLTYKYCRDDCLNLPQCYSTIILSEYCKAVCPYFKVVNETALAAYMRTSPDEQIDRKISPANWIAIGVSVVIAICLCCLLFYLYKKREMVRDIWVRVKMWFRDRICSRTHGTQGFSPVTQNHHQTGNTDPTNDDIDASRSIASVAGGFSNDNQRTGDGSSLALLSDGVTGGASNDSLRTGDGGSSDPLSDPAFPRALEKQHLAMDDPMEDIQANRQRMEDRAPIQEEH